jgi:hypothetical protein
LKECLGDQNIPPSSVEQGSVASFDLAETCENQGVSEHDFLWVAQLSPNTYEILDDFSRGLKEPPPLF